MKIALLGYGKMGKTIERVARDRGHEVVLVVDENNRAICTDDQLKQADVAIEFTTPAVAVDNYNWCFRNHVPVVSGTTGWLERWSEVMMSREQLGGAFFYASNYSIGVNIFFHLNRWLAQTMARFSDYKVSVEETHHIHKLDAPSGTALMLADAINEQNNGEYHYVYDRSAVRQKRDPKEIGISSVRGGSIVGDHEVLFCGPDEVITLKHTAYSRNIFANGAVNAAVYLANKEPGLYNMGDLIAAL